MNAKTVAVLGASANRRKFGNKGLRAFQAAGWRVFAVNPNEPAVEGLPTVAGVADIAEPLDVVSFYVPAAVGLKLLPAVAAKNPGELWLNPGAESAELLAAAAAFGLRVRQTCSIIQVGYRPSDFP
jgi:predicted CoA-binding protein